MSTLKALRISKKLTQQQACELLGISLRSYKEYENNESKTNSLKYRSMVAELEKLEKELEYLKVTGRKDIAEKIKIARGFGDLSENAEYHAAKRERGKNESRIRYLRNMIKTAIIIDVKSEDDSVGLFDTITYYVEGGACYIAALQTYTLSPSERAQN